MSNDGFDEGNINDQIIDFTSDIVAAYVGHNTISTGELPNLIESVHSALSGLGTVASHAMPQEPAVLIRSSVKPNCILCLECGKRFQSIKRHIRTSHDLTPDEYRAKWNLKPGYPMVAPEYSEARSKLAKRIGLGQKAVV